VLDLGLPDVDGTQVLGMIRGISAVPVIVATARDDENEMVWVLDLGADDYVVKPFSAEQARGQAAGGAAARPDGRRPDPALTVGGPVRSTGPPGWSRSTGAARPDQDGVRPARPTWPAGPGGW
jgi:hypothetical protein